MSQKRHFYLKCIIYFSILKLIFEEKRGEPENVFRSGTALVFPIIIKFERKNRLKT